MPITSSDIHIRYSIKTGSSGNSQAQTNPNQSLGKYISTTTWPGSSLHDLFDKVTAIENQNLDEEYRCVFIYNAHSTLVFENVKIWIQSEVAGGAELFLGADPTAASAVNSSSDQAVSVLDEDTAPAGVTFSKPTSLATAINLGNINPGFCKAFWIKRKANNTGAIFNDGGVITIYGESGP